MGSMVLNIVTDEITEYYMNFKESCIVVRARSRRVMPLTQVMTMNKDIDVECSYLLMT